MRTFLLLFSISCTCLAVHAEDTEFEKALKSGLRNIAVTMPDYPVEALKNKIVGKVLFEFGLDEKGAPKNLEIVSSEPPGIFDESVKKALTSWRYLPNMKAPCNVAVSRAQQQIWLEIQEGEPRISMSKVLNLPDIKEVLDPNSNDRDAAQLVPGNVDDNRTVLMKNSGLRYKNKDDVEIRYPPEALRKGFQDGFVVTVFSAKPDGTIDDVSIIYSVPPGVFDKEILQAQKEYVVETHSGKPPGRKVNVCQQYQFNLK